MKFGIVVFPGTWSDTDCYFAVHDILNQDAEYVWHKDTNIDKFDCLILPGGISYGDYIRPGAMAKLSPIMNSIKEFALKGKFIIGICNGFQILCESELLPGTLIKNTTLQFRCQWTNLVVTNNDNPFTNICTKGSILNIPISHGEGNYFIDNAGLQKLYKNDQIVLQYSDINGTINDQSNPNGSVDNIAGIINQNHNVIGMMPHPERSCETILGSTDGNKIFQSIIRSIEPTLFKEQP